GRYEGAMETNGKVNWKKAGPDSYNTIAESEKAMYFDMGSKWGEVKEKYKLTDDQMFQLFNKPALDRAVNKGKMIKFAHNPEDLSNRREFLGDVWRYLKDEYGYKREVDGRSE